MESPIKVVDTVRGKFLINKNDRYCGRSLEVLGEFAQGQVDFFDSVVTKQWIVVDAGSNMAQGRRKNPST